jgi:ribosomal protein S18 acetylase RimI-like enzyme
VRVRPATTADVAALVELAQGSDPAVGAGSGRTSRENGADRLTGRVGAVLDDGVHTLLVAVEESTDRIVGLLIAREDEIGLVEPTSALFVTHLLVVPAARRRGVGRALLAGALHLAEEQGLDRVVATAAASSREANRYLARLGFAPLVTHRVVPTPVLRRSLGLTDSPERVAVLRRAMLGRARRGEAAPTRTARQGA